MKPCYELNTKYSNTKIIIMKTTPFTGRHIALIAIPATALFLALTVISCQNKSRDKKAAEFTEAVLDACATSDSIFVEADYSTTLPYQYVVDILYHNPRIAKGIFRNLLDTIGTASISKLSEELGWPEAEERNSIRRYRELLAQQADSLYAGFSQDGFSDKIQSFNARLTVNNRLIARATEAVFKNPSILEASASGPEGAVAGKGAKASAKGARLLKAVRVVANAAGPVSELVHVVLDEESKPLLQLLFEHAAAHEYAESLAQSSAVRSVAELATARRAYEILITYHKDQKWLFEWLTSTAMVEFKVTGELSYGFNLYKGFRISVKENEIHVHLPAPELLSVDNNYLITRWKDGHIAKIRQEEINAALQLAEAEFRKQDSSDAKRQAMDEARKVFQHLYAPFLSTAKGKYTLKVHCGEAPGGVYALR